MQLGYDHSNALESLESMHKTKLHDVTNTIFPMQFGAVFPHKHKKLVMGGWGEARRKKLNGAPSHEDRPAFCIWPDRGAPLLCVWCHSSESHQSHTGWNTSVSRTHNCLPLRKYIWNFKNMAFTRIARGEIHLDSCYGSKKWVIACIWKHPI